MSSRSAVTTRSTPRPRSARRRSISPSRPAAAAPVTSGPGAVVYRRNPEVKGPMSAFAYDFFADHYQGGSGVRLLDYEGLRGEGGDYAYEVLNFVDGHRTVAEIRDAVAA